MPTLKNVRASLALEDVFCCLFMAFTLEADETDSLANFTQEGMELWHVPGMAVAVVGPNEIEFMQGFGQTAIERGEVVDAHTLFAIASTTKAMITAAVMMLVDEGKLSLDDSVSHYIPELHFAPPLDGATITVRDLLAHRTGLPSTDFWAFAQAMPLNEQIVRLQHVSPEAPIRTRLIYQNTMFTLSGELIRRLSGIPWDQFLNERLWQPIGMEETYSTRGQISEQQTHVMPYQYINDELVLEDWDFTPEKSDPAGSVWSSIHDMSLWAQFLLRDGITDNGQRLLSEASFAELFEPQMISSEADFYPTIALTQPNWRTYGLGWFQQDFQGRKIDFHTGSLSGLIALIGLDRAQGRAVVILGNRDHAEMRHAVLWEVMDSSTGDARRDWNRDIFELYTNAEQEAAIARQQQLDSRLANTHPALSLDQYTGTYSSNVNGDVTVELKNGKLVLKTALWETPMSHWALESFRMEFPNRPNDISLAGFSLGPDGAVHAIEFFGMEFTRVGKAD